MGYSTNYAGLKADLIQNTDDQSDDFFANIDTIIAQAEDQVIRDLNLEIMQDEVSIGPLSAGNRLLARPSSLLKINGIWVQIGTSRKFVEKRTKGYCETFGEDGVQAQPKYYAEVNQSSLMFVSTPDQAYPVIGYGIIRPTGLSDTVQTTWLSTKAGDLLLLACQIASEQYLRDATQANVWKGEYANDRLPKAKIELRGMARAEYSMASTPL